MRFYRLIFLFILFPSICFAAAYQGKVANVFASSNKVYIFVNKGYFDNSSSCTGETSYFVLWLDPSTDYGRAMLSIALTAKTSKTLVWVSGDNNCSIGPSSHKAEKLLSIDLKGD
ncbi:hypothetical protein [Gallaecimonas pentaromativorans]|uniref:hypothetical protein n=1 Tax=Gallaecimonas pentaromativorans TaxID=584787 RepID=UPI0011CE4DEB|nr:hypothetical protein [Gallaecimonas pentaromativorans]